MKPFFITGLPRSGTAWCANLLSFGESFCFHEGFLEVDPGDYAGLRKVMESAGTQFVGSSDPMNCLAWRELAKEFPDSKWVIVERPLVDAARSASTAFGIDYKTAKEMAHTMARELIELSIHRDCLVVRFSDLFESGKEILDHCAPGLICPENRIKLLSKMNVKLSQESFVKLTSPNSIGWFQLLYGKGASWVQS